MIIKRYLITGNKNYIDLEKRPRRKKGVAPVSCAPAIAS